MNGSRIPPTPLLHDSTVGDVKERVQPARIIHERGRILSADYNDFYYQRGDQAEVEQVFLQPAHIRQRFRNTSLFTIVEFGFGTGLNFATSLSAFIRESRQPSRLRFVSVEKHPLSHLDHASVLKAWPDFNSFSAELLDAYPPPICGWHTRFFCQGRVQACVFVGDVNEGISQFLEEDQIGVDAWFLDGFAPGTNPQMWQPDLLRQISRKTRQNGTVTTYSVAGAVRRALEAGGFRVTKVPGVPPKRHTLLGEFLGPGFRTRPVPGRVTVAGGGLAGSTLARSLADRQVPVTLLRPHPAGHPIASDISHAIMHARLSGSEHPQGLFRMHSQCHSSSRSWGMPGVTRVGALQVPDSNFTQERLEQVCRELGPAWALLVSPNETQCRFGIEFEKCVGWFPRSATVDVPRLCEALTHHELISVAPRLLRLDDHERGPVVAATGSNLPLDLEMSPIELAAIWGQVDRFRSLSKSFAPRVIVKDGYVSMIEDEIVVGSTYEHAPWIDGRATQVNVSRLQKVLPGIDVERLSAFRAKRGVTSDRLPAIGRAGDNIWASLGHGSSGTTSTFYAADLVAAELASEFIPATSEIRNLIDPERFAIRQRRRPNPFKARQNAAPSIEPL